ncbi:hypothetical protein ACHAXS_008621 [Conticribra weissflogii]
MSTAAPPTSPSPSTYDGGGGGNSSGSGNVLSDKVNRALHVRTDTPAMRAALDALANLPSEDHFSGSIVGGIGGSHSAGNANGSSAPIDARSVRMAIERDALRRALQFQSELRRLAGDATVLRERVDRVAKVANLVGSRIETPIVVSSAMAAAPPESMFGAATGGGVSSTASARYATAGGDEGGGNFTSENAWEEERALASKLHSARHALLEATQRQIAVEAFLDKFDLGETEARLLDHYDFEGFIEGGYRTLHHRGHGGEDGGGQLTSPWSHPNAALRVIGQPDQSAMEDATAFLDALERLVIIRAELTKTFGGTGIADGADKNKRSYEHDNRDDDDGINDDDADAALAPGGQLGTHSALRMMEQLASRQQRAHERLYQFLQFYLGIGNAAPSQAHGHHHVPTSSSDMHNQHHRPSDMALYASLGRFHSPDEMDEAYTLPILRRSLHVLRHSPSHHCHALELIAASRRTEVTRRFLLGLTSGYEGMAPMEMRAHDPVAYVGDMLAFAFRAFRVEGELVKSLMTWRDDEEGSDEEEDGGLDASGRAGNKNGAKSKQAAEEGEVNLNEEDEDRGDVPMDLAEMLAQSMGGLARPLRSRISQVVKSLASQGNTDDHGFGGRNGLMGRAAVMDAGGTNDTDDDGASSSLHRLVAVFSVCGLLKFYGSAVRKALKNLQTSQRRANHDEEEDPYYYCEEAKNPFLLACDECLSEAANSYVASLRAYGAMLEFHSGPDETEAQLAQKVIVRISEERVASPGFAEDSLLGDGTASSAEKEEDLVSKQLSLAFLVGTMIEAAMPYLRTLDDGAAIKAALTSATKCGLKTKESTQWHIQVEEREKILVQTLVDSEANKVLETCGLSTICTALSQMNGVYVEGMTMASYPGLSQSQVEMAMKDFYSSLYSPPIPSFEETIKDPEWRKRARSMTAIKVVEVYRELYEAMKGEKGGYDSVAFLGHDPEQVKTLLSI